MAANLTLKWGNVKAWEGFDEDHPASPLMHAYLEHAGLSAMERQSDEQRERICSIIDAVDGVIWNDWDGVEMSKDEAKKYVREYGEGRIL